MWRRIYPCAVLLILVNIILKASCKGNGSLTFLIDDTISMSGDIRQVRQSVHRIKDIVLHEKSSLIDNMVLITLNDPGVHEKIVTRDPDEFKKAISALRTHNEALPSELDCWEPAMKGLLLALDKSKTDSFIFVFTDAPAKDYTDSKSVIEMCQEKQIQIVFVLTGTLCGKFPYPPGAINSFFDIAVACSGLAIYVRKNEVNKVFGPIEEIIKGNKTMITTATVPAGITRKVPFKIDEYTDNVIVYAYGKNVYLKINGHLVYSKVLMTDNAKAIKLSNTKPGSYDVTVKSDTRTSVVVVGKTDFFFSHGFSESKPKSLSDTSQTTYGDTKIYLSVSVTDDPHSVKIVSAQLIDMDGKPIRTKLPLTEVSEDFYITDPFIAPSQMFKVAVNGIVIATNTPIDRSSKIPVTPSPPKIAPKVEGRTLITVNEGETAYLECKVIKGFPAPKITWLFGDNSDSTFTPIHYDSVLVIPNTKYKDDGIYKCVAENVKGKDEHVTTLYVLGIPQMVSSNSTVYESTEEDALLKIPCNVAGRPKPSITWMLNGRVIIPNAKYSIEGGTLEIKNPTVGDTNSYTCEAKNGKGTVSATFKTYIRQKPHVSGVPVQKTRVGLAASIKCTADKGVPKPIITWQFKDKFSSKFVPIAGSDDVLHISRVEIKHAGSYKCEAENSVGHDVHITALVVQDQPKIASNISTVYESTEGDALLKIPCTADGLPKPSITWKLHGVDISPSAKYSIVDGTLIISNPKVNDTDSYTCEAKNEVGAVKATFTANIRQKPHVSGVPVQKARVGLAASIKCTVDKGAPKPTITWQFMDESNSKFVPIAGTDDVLHIPRVEIKHAGRYKCEAQNSVGYDEHITALVVQERPHVSGVAVQKAKVGSAANIDCTINKGVPKPTITWQFMDDSSSIFLTIAGTDDVLHISKVEIKHAGSYKCVAQNSVGNDEHITALVVQDPPKIDTSVSTTYESTEKDALLRIPCDVAGLPKPIITWKVDGRVINPSPKYSIEGGALIIRDPKVSDTNSYTCEAKNEIGVVSATFKAYIQQRPHVSGVAVQKAKVGSTASIDCTIDKGVPKPTITWQFMDDSGSIFLPIAETDDVLHISKVEIKHAGSYKCVAQNSVGHDEHITALVVQDPPKIDTSVSTTYESTEKDALLRIPCDVAGLPKPIITWKVDGRVINPNPKYSIEGGALIIRDPKVSDTNSYTCEAKNEIGVVSATFKAYIQQKPHVSGVAVQKAKVGSTASIDCTIDKGVPKPTITWQFMDDSGSIFLPIAETDDVLHISKVEIKHAGSYKCVAQNSVGHDEHITVLVVQDPPKIDTSVSTTYESTEKDALLRIPCDVAGLPKPIITWKVDGRVINPSLKYSIEGGALIIKNPKVSDTNSYTCEAKNEIGVVSATFKAYIQQRPHVSGVAFQKAKVGSTASIDCTIDKGVPKPTITWQFMDESSSIFLPIAGTDDVLHISKVEIKHAGSYKCVAQNSVGNDEHITALVVQDPPKIDTSVSTTYESTEKDALLRIPCDVAGLPKPIITWKVDGRVINPSLKYSIEGGALIIKNPKVSDTNSYTCEAKNEIGVVSATFKACIQQRPHVSGVAVQKAKVGSTASIDCTIDKGVPKPTITWQFMDESSSIFLPIAGTDDVLHISKVEIKHAGSYKCVAQNSVGNDEHITALVVQDPPKIDTSVSTTYESTEKDAVLRIPCDVAGLPKPIITWKVDGRVINPSSKYSIEGGALIIRDPKVSDTNSYTCEAKNEIGVVSATFKAYIQQRPHVSGVAVQKAKVGSTAGIDCTIDKGVPKPTITWQFMDESSSIFLPIAGTDDVLHISKVEIKHAGSYKCVAQNSVGNDEHITALVVQDSPKINTSVSTTYESTEKDALLRIPCDVAGLPKPIITWKVDGRVINPSPKYSIEAGALIIRDPIVSDTNSYTCEAKNEIGVVSATFKAYIQQRPHVSGVAVQKAKVDSTASIDCTIDKGVPKPTITWQFMDESSSIFSPIAGTDDELHISKVEIKHAGSYKCVAQNSVGNDEHITALVVQDPPKIDTSVSTTYESTEKDALLRIPCDAAGLPKPIITWKVDGRVINPSPKYSIEGGALIIRDPKVSDTNSYTCEAKNEIGVVSATFKAYIQQRPHVSGVAVQKAKVGSTASIDCTIDKGVPKPTITWQFMDESGSIFLPIAETEDVLHISKVEIKHAGSYKCVARNSVGHDEHITALVVQDPPKIDTSVSTTYESTEKDALLRIPCDVAGLPKPIITWKVDGRVINPSPKYSIEDGALIIRDPKLSDTNSYTCEAKNEVGVVSATFKTYIRQAPQLSGPAAMKVKIGSTAYIKCTVKGEPKPTVAWQFMDNSSPDFLPIPGSSEELHISRVEIKHAGSYKCVAQNSVGSDEHVTTLEVQDPPKIASNSSTIYQSTEGDALLRIPCTASGLPKPSITWKIDGHDLNLGTKYYVDDGMLVITHPTVIDTNSYTCEANNEVGTDSATFKTYIRQIPKLSGVASKNVKIGTPVDIKCMIDQGEPTPTISWQFMDKPGSKFVPIDGLENTLTIKKAEKKHAGLYKCVARNNVGSDDHVTTLIIEYKPSITINSTNIKGIKGDLALRIPCNITAVPQPVITWKIKGTKINPNEKYSVEDGALVIANPVEADSSSYTCEATNSIGSVSATFQAAVTTYPKNFGTEHYVYLKQGETRKLNCEAYTSRSQSVQWFLTREDLDWMLSTTTPAAATDLETTTSSSTLYSPTMPRTTTQYAGKKEYIQITNASSIDHDGNYTCRVSDKHGNIQTHTYVVDVGIAPKFVSEYNSIDDWRGDSNDIKQSCGIVAKPLPVVQWTFNGKELTDISSADRAGHYTCNVSNVHGFVFKQIDVKSSACLIKRNLRNDPYMPILLNGEGFWHEFVNTEHYTVVEHNDNIILSCPNQKDSSNTFKKFPKLNLLEATCNREYLFIVNGQTYDLSNLQCTNDIQPTIIKKKLKCSTETSELIRVGYNLPGFLEAYEVCFDYKINMPLYTRVIMTENNNKSSSADYNWYTYPGIGSDKTERGFTCKDTSSTCCYSKSQLVHDIDFNDGAAKKSTFIDPLNVIPVWLPCDTSKVSWVKINNMVRSQLPIYTEIVVWSGTHTFEDKDGAVIPRYLWKVVRLDDDLDMALAIVYINDPKPLKSDFKCKTNICDRYHWISRDYFIYCCSLQDFLESFDFHHTNIGELLEAARDRMKTKTDSV